MIRFYDIAQDRYRELTQDDWEAADSRLIEQYGMIRTLQLILRDHGIPLPGGMKDYTPKSKREDYHHGRTQQRRERIS